MARHTRPITRANIFAGTVRSGNEIVSPGMARTNVVVSPAVPRRPKRTVASRPRTPMTIGVL